MAKPLNELKGKKKQIQNKDHQKTFDKLKEKDYESTGTLSPEERRKIQSGNGCLRTCYLLQIKDLRVGQ